MHSFTETSWPAAMLPVQFAAFASAAKDPLATPAAAEVFELHQAADFRRHWQAQPAATRPPLYLVFMLTDGEGLHRVGSEAFYVRPGTLGFLGPEALANWQPGPAAQQGYFCVFTEAFFSADRADHHLWRSLPFFAAPSAAEALTPPPEATGALMAQFAQLAADAQAGQPAAPLLRAQLTVLLLRAAACYRDALPAAPCAGQRLTNAFLALLEEDLAPLLTGQPIEQATVRAYAQRLRVSQNHLNDTVRRHTGHSAGTLAHDALARVATDLLGQGGRPVHEVARLLGFTSATYFARFYRHRIGHTPSQARRRAAA